MPPLLPPAMAAEPCASARIASAGHQRCPARHRGAVLRGRGDRRPARDRERLRLAMLRTPGRDPGGRRRGRRDIGRRGIARQGRDRRADGDDLGRRALPSATCRSTLARDLDRDLGRQRRELRDELRPPRSAGSSSPMPARRRPGDEQLHAESAARRQRPGGRGAHHRGADRDSDRRSRGRGWRSTSPPPLLVMTGDVVLLVGAISALAFRRSPAS